MPLKTVWEKLDQYQKDAVKFTLQVQTAALFFEQGTGKTWIAGGVIEQMLSWYFSGVMVVPLTNLESTWLTFFDNHLPQLNVCRTFEEFRDTPCPKLWLINYEGLKPWVKKLKKMWLSFIGYDEAQRLKGRGSRQSRDAKLLNKSAEVKMILTGTPQEHSPADLWAEFRFLRPSLLGERWADFQEEYMLMPDIDPKLRPGTSKWKWALRFAKRKKPEFNEELLPQLMEILRPYSWRVEAKDVLDLPPLEIVPVAVQMVGAQLRRYEEMERHMITRVQGETIVAPLKITQVTKLQQLCGGILLKDDRVFRVGTAKLDKLLRLIEQQIIRKSGPIVVFCKYLPEIDLIQEALKRYRGMIVQRVTGKIKGNKRTQLIEDFQAGKINVLICQVRTGGIGIDLFRSNCAICYSVTHSRIEYDQLIKRLHRRGQTRPVTIFLLHCVGTVDGDIASGIRRKNRLSRQTLTHLIRRRNNHG